MSNSMRPHRWQPTRLHCPWDSPGNNTGLGCHFLLQCVKVKSQSEVTQSCPTLSDSKDCSLLGFSIHGIFQAKVLEWGAIAFCLSEYRFQFMKPFYFCFLLSLKSLMTNSDGKVSLLHTMANKPINSICEYL